MAKEWAKAFYNSTLWQQQRAAVLKRDHYLCTQPGCYNPAEEVHHRVELTPENIDNPNIALAMSNLTSLCGTCHKKITKREHGKGTVILPEMEFDEEGYPRPVSPRG